MIGVLFFSFKMTVISLASVKLLKYSHKVSFPSLFLASLSFKIVKLHLSLLFSTNKVSNNLIFLLIFFSSILYLIVNSFLVFTFGRSSFCLTSFLIFIITSYISIKYFNLSIKFGLLSNILKTLKIRFPS